MKNLIHGVGVNDANYKITRSINDKRSVCPFYQTWHNMLKRAYSSKFHLIQPSYKDVTVCKEWHSFMNFKRWMEKQDWEGKQLDKDLLLSGNKVYSPETCIFISQEINQLLVKSDGSRGDYPLWVNYIKSSNKFRARVKSLHLGIFNSAMEAHKAGQQYKIKLLMDASLCEPFKVKNALLFIVNKIQCDIDNNLETKEY